MNTSHPPIPDVATRTPTKFQQIPRHHSLTLGHVSRRRRVRKPGVHRRIHVQQMTGVRPRARPRRQSNLPVRRLRQRVRSVFVQRRELRRTPRSSGEPDDDGIVSRVVRALSASSLEKRVKQVRILGEFNAASRSRAVRRRREIVSIDAKPRSSFASSRAREARHASSRRPEG